MTVRVRRDGATFRKAVTDPAFARQLVGRTASLRNAGVATPAARLDAEAHELVFPAIEGQSGLALISDQGPAALPVLIGPLRQLHRSRIGGLAPFDPGAKIRPRLAPGDPARLRDELETCMASLSAVTSAGPVHGDFHPGQVVIDASGSAWLLDLDDLALAPPEADLGNLAAHLATRPETRRSKVAAGFADWLGAVLAAYRTASTAPVPRLARLYGRIALLRRGLKLRQRGEPEVLAELAAAEPHWRR